MRKLVIGLLSVLIFSGAANAQSYRFKVVASGLNKPNGITVEGSEVLYITPVGIALDHRGEHLYFTEVPTPGIGGSAGGQNKISELNLSTGQVTLVHFGDPEPTDVAVARNGNIYWTCTAAGVIVEARPIRGGGQD